MHSVNLTKNLLMDSKELEPSEPSGSKQFLWDLQVRGFGAWKSSKLLVTFVYQFRSPIDNRTRRTTLGQLGEISVQQARDLARDLASKVRHGIDPVEEKRQERTARIAEDALKLRNYVPVFYETRGKEKPLARQLQQSLEQDVLPALGDMQMARITSAQVLDLGTKLEKRSPTAKRRGIEVLKLVLNAAKRAELITRAATDTVPTPKSGVRDRAFSRFEIARYLEAVHDLGTHRAAILTVLFLLLRRVNEVAKMVWEEVDQQTWTWTLRGPRSKNRKPQILMLPRQVVAILQATQPDPKTRRGFVFSVRPKGKDISNKVWDMLDANLDRRLDLHAAAVNAPRPDFEHYTIHDGRTSAASMLQKKPLSIPPHIIEAALNHMSQESGLKPVYQTHRYAEEVGEMLQRWADLVDEIMLEQDAWLGGRDLPPLGVDEREQRATNLRQNWTERKKIARRSSSYAHAKGAARKRGAGGAKTARKA